MRNHSLKFWQKTYLLTLAFFLVALFGGIGFIAWQNQQQSLTVEVENVKREQRFLVQNITTDLAAIDKMATPADIVGSADAALNDGSHDSAPADEAANLHVSLLMKSYGQYYSQEGLFIEVRKNDETLYSNLPNHAVEAFGGVIDSGTQSWVRESLDDGQYLIAASTLSGKYESYRVVCARSLEPLLASWNQMNATSILGSVLMSIIVALGLFFILRQLSKPLEGLAATADTFSAGDFQIRAEEKSSDEVGMLAASFNAMADAAESHIQEMSQIAGKNAQMAASLSHEIRTPLTAIKGFAEYMQMADLDEQERSSALTYIIEETTRLQNLSQRMLQLFSLEHDGVVFRKVDLGEITDRAVLSLRPKAAQAQVDLFAGTHRIEEILGDDVLVESLLTNLLDNAIASCSAGDCVTVELGKTSDTVRLAISDTGCGLKQEELARMGEPFYRPDKARSRKGGGAGLGVALCYEIAGLHGAKISYESQFQQGTTVSVEFTRP